MARRLWFLLFATACVSEEPMDALAVPPLRFTDVTQRAGLTYRHGITMLRDTPEGEVQLVSAGVAAGDFDDDGDIDLYAVRGDVGANLLLRNRGDGTYEDIAMEAGVAIDGEQGCGPVFADIDGDGRLDLFVGGVVATRPSLFRNTGSGYEDVTARSGLADVPDTISASFGDHDLDGDLDVWLAHWENPSGAGGLWENDGTGVFTDVSTAAGLHGMTPNDFTANWVDVDLDGQLDLLIAGDYGSSRLFKNNGDGTFTNGTTDVFDDENGMGAAIGDYDNDGDLDWFVTSIHSDAHPFSVGFGTTGNRLYRNRGNGTFEDATEEAGVREGHWGWGACFADLNNDGALDLFHVNGFINITRPDLSLPFADDPSRLFVSNRDGTFTERARESGIDDRAQGRGVVCFDYDRDGDIDLLISNNRDAPRLYRNDTGAELNGLTVRLRGAPPNTAGVGALVRVKAQGKLQMRQVRIGNNFVSHDPAEVHFGVADAVIIESVRVDWPSGRVSQLQSVAPNQVLEIAEARSR